MTNTTNQTKATRMSPSWRKHVRRLKQDCPQDRRCLHDQPARCFNPAGTQKTAVIDRALK